MTPDEYTDQIAMLHSEGCDVDEAFREVVLQKLEVTRKTGLVIAAAARELPPDVFIDVTKGTCIDDQAIRAYINFAHSHPEPVEDINEGSRCLRSVLCLTGLVTPAQPPLKCRAAPDPVLTALEHLNALLRKTFREKPINRQKKDRLDAILARLTPIADFSNQILAWLSSAAFK